MLYAFQENFVLPLSHDEVVHGKGSLLGKMPGDDWQKFANLRLLFGYMYAQPGKKLLFMGGEFGQWREWNHEDSLDWHLLQYEPHAGLQRWVQDLNHLYRTEPALHELDFDPAGFEWIDCDDSESSIAQPHAERKISGGPGSRGLELHSRSPAQLPDGGPLRRFLEGDAQQRRRNLRGKRSGKSGGDRSGPYPFTAARIC